MHNSKFNGMPNWTLSKEKCPATKGFAAGTMVPGKISATTRKQRDKRDNTRVQFADITRGKEK